MKTQVDLDAIVIDGARLKAAREARGASVADMAGLITLSREQIRHIEDGGNRPFYTPAHKLLAVRKYANALDIPYDEVVSGPGADQTLPVPEDAPVSMMSHAELPEPSDLRLAAVERNAEIRKLTTFGAIALCILLAVYAKLRGNHDGIRTEETSAALAAHSTTDTGDPPETEVATPGTVAAVSDTKAAQKTTQPRAAPKMASESQHAAASKAEPETARVADAGEECALRADSEVKTWAPAYHRKPDSRLFLVSPRGGSVCVVDASGKSTLLSLKPMVAQSFVGKPPYVVRSSELAKIEMYMQGLRVKIPADAGALRLVPAREAAPPPDATETESRPDT